MISISLSLNTSDEVRHSDYTTDESVYAEGEWGKEATSRRPDKEFDLFDEARRIYIRARATRRVRSSNII
jgi:hypothetical protein